MTESIHQKLDRILLLLEGGLETEHGDRVFAVLSSERPLMMDDEESVSEWMETPAGSGVVGRWKLLERRGPSEE